jgi:hypothetical protein
VSDEERHDVDLMMEQEAELAGAGALLAEQPPGSE